MDNIENKGAPQSELNDWRAHYDSMHNLVVSIVVLLIIVSGTLWIFLRWQVKYTGIELETVRPQATNFIAQYEKVTKPAMDTFINKLADYGRTHPDFAPIMTKYGIKPPGSTGNAAPAAVPPTAAPPAAATKKK
jgi:hypothetical protein